MFAQINVHSVVYYLFLMTAISVSVSRWVKNKYFFEESSAVRCQVQAVAVRRFALFVFLYVIYVGRRQMS